MTRVQSRRHLTPIPFSVSGLMSWGQYTEDRFKWTPIVALSVSRGCLHNIGIIECHLTLATQTLSQCGERRITDDNKILVYCNEIKSTLIHLKYSGTVERVSYKYIYLTTLSCHQSTGAWRRLRSGVTGTWETQIMSRCSVCIYLILICPSLTCYSLAVTGWWWCCRRPAEGAPAPVTHPSP